MSANAGLPPECFLAPTAGDGRPPLSEVLRAFEPLREAGWRERQISSQFAPSGGALPIRAYFNAEEVDAVLIGGIHGREPAGALALARYASRLKDQGCSRGLLMMPLLNPWGYLRHERYGPTGRSVSGSDHLLGRLGAPGCSEAAAITDFVMNGIRIRPGAQVLDLHEDPVYEVPGYELRGRGSYVYLAGQGALDHPLSRRVRDCLRDSSLPLIRDGVTRFG